MAKGRKVSKAQAQKVVIAAVKRGDITEAQLNARGFTFNMQTGKLSALPTVRQVAPTHDCWANAVPYESDGALGHGWECGVCGTFLQAG